MKQSKKNNKDNDTRTGTYGVYVLPPNVTSTTNICTSTAAKKNDKDKLRWDLLPVEPMKKVVEVYTIGARKYDDRNWEKGFNFGRVYAAMQRHATAWWGGERDDQDDGQHHLASVCWCALALMEFERTHPKLDDRPYKEVKLKFYTRKPLPKGLKLPNQKVEIVS